MIEYNTAVVEGDSGDQILQMYAMVLFYKHPPPRRAVLAACTSQCPGWHCLVAAGN